MHINRENIHSGLTGENSMNMQVSGDPLVANYRRVYLQLSTNYGETKGIEKGKSVMSRGAENRSLRGPRSGEVVWQSLNKH